MSEMFEGFCEALTLSGEEVGRDTRRNQVGSGAGRKGQSGGNDGNESEHDGTERIW